MNNNLQEVNYTELKDSELKIEKDCKELQKTIIYYGQKILLELQQIKALLEQKQEKEQM